MLIKKIIKNLFNRDKSVLDKNHFQYASVAENTILKNGLRIRFDKEKEKEKRIYVTIGRVGIISASFIFESPKGEVIIGDNVHIGYGTFISRSKITVGNDVTMAWGITLYDHNSHSIYWSDRKNDNSQCYQDYMNCNGNNIVNKDWSNVRSAPITIHDKVWIGFDVTILKGVTIGTGTVVGAKSVVTKDIPSWVVVAGNPAVIIKNIPEDKRY